MKTHAIRLTYGMDLKEEIEKYTIENNISAGCILSAVGCLNKLVLRTAGAIFASAHLVANVPLKI